MIYRESDIFIMASHHESLPRTIFEAMANSTPVIATNVGGIKYEFQDEVDIIKIDPKNSIQIYEAIIKLIKNTKLRKTIIKNGFHKSTKMTLDFSISSLKKHLI